MAVDPVVSSQLFLLPHLSFTILDSNPLKLQRNQIFSFIINFGLMVFYHSNRKITKTCSFTTKTLLKYYFFKLPCRAIQFLWHFHTHFIFAGCLSPSVAVLDYFVGSSILFHPFSPLILDKREKQDEQEKMPE